MSDEIWLPAALPPVESQQFAKERLSIREQAILRRLRGGRWQPRAGQPAGGSAAARTRRRVLARLQDSEIRVLLSVIDEIRLG